VTSANVFPHFRCVAPSFAPLPRTDLEAIANFYPKPPISVFIWLEKGAGRGSRVPLSAQQRAWPLELEAVGASGEVFRPIDANAAGFRPG
jgi:hypothetical protein